MDITSLRNVPSGAVREAAQQSLSKIGGSVTDTTSFDNMLSAAVSNLNTTNAYLSDAENEQVRWALGETESTHDLTIALQKASTALQYTTAVRDKFIEAYREIMQIQI